MKHFGMVCLGIPSEFSDTSIDGAEGYADHISFAILENGTSEGLDHPAGKIKNEDGSEIDKDDFEVFRFADDVVDFMKLSGFALYYLGDKEGCKKVLLRGRELAGAVLLTGWVEGEGPVCFHTEKQARDIVKWFCAKQAVWYAQYKHNSQTEKAGAEEASGWGEGSRGPGETCH